MKIGVFGSSSNNMTEQVRANARRLGAEIARAGHVLVTGAGSGVPHEAVMGAHEAGGKTIGFSPATSLESHVHNFDFPAEGYSELVFVPKDFKYASNPAYSAKIRSIFAIAHSDAVVIIGGRTGTMNEFIIAFDAGKNIGILENSGGITDRAIGVLLQEIDKSRGAKIIRSEDPVELLRKMIELDEQDRHITF